MTTNWSETNRVPVVLHRREGDDMPLLEKTKYMVPRDMMFMHFMCVLRRRLTLPPHKALFLFTGCHRLVPASSSISEVHHADKGEDGVLHITYASENVFG
jgi:GABA(A) receptor-associated protein